MKKLFFYICILITTFAYSQVTYVGEVVDNKNQPIEFADIILQRNGKIIKGTVSNEKGKYEIVAEKGVYLFVVSFLGYEKWEKKIELSDNITLEKVVLKENSEKLNEINVASNTKVFKRATDRVIFDVKNSLIGKANGNVTELLNFTPSVIAQDNGIQVFGKEGVLVLINGRDSKLRGEALMSFLRSMKSSDIDSIEIINTPPAKYEANGNIALINVILKKKDVEFWNSNISTSYRQGYHAVSAYSGSFNYNKKKLFLTANLTKRSGETRGEESNVIYYPDNPWNQETNYKYETDLWTANLSSEYRVNSNWLFGAQYTGSFNTPNSSNTGNISVQESGLNNGVLQIETSGREEGDKDFNSFNFHSVINVTPKKTINVDFDYFDYELSQNSNVLSVPNQTGGDILDEETRIENKSNQNISNFSSKVDVDYALKKGMLNFGGKVTFSKTNNDVLITGIVDFDQETQFSYKEDIQALYASFSNTFGLSEWSFQSGLRMERTQTLAQEKILNSEVRNDYVNFFPTLYINYKPSQHHNFSLDYSKRIHRPVFNALNPFRIYTSPFSYSEGNPNLLPAISSQVILSHIYKSALSTAVYFSYVENNSGQVAVLDNDNLTQSITRLNYFDNYDIGIWANYLYNKKKWWQSSNTLQLYYNESTSKIHPITPRSITGIGAVLKTTNHFMLGKEKKWVVGFDFTYRFPNTSNELIYNFEQYFLNAFAKYNITDKLQVSLAANNIFREYNFNNLSTRNNTDAIYRGYYDTQYLKFSLNYNFGSNKVRRTNRNVGNKDEKNRI